MDIDLNKEKLTIRYFMTEMTQEEYERFFGKFFNEIQEYKSNMIRKLIDNNHENKIN